MTELTALGFALTQTDLRADRAAEQLADTDVVWVRGGNSLRPPASVADTGMDGVLVELIQRNQITHAGDSPVRACVLAPDLADFETVDHVHAVADPVYQGLGMLDHPFVPHVRSPGHPETHDCDAISARLSRCGIEHWAPS